MTIDEAFDRIETVPPKDVREGDVIQVDPGSAPKEVTGIETSGHMIKFQFADGSYRFVGEMGEVALFME